MKKFKFLTIFLVICLMCSLLLTSGAAALDDPSVSSGSAIIIDRATGEVLFELNADAKIYPASTTKIMTVLLAVEAVEAGTVSLHDEVTASSNISFDLVEDGSTAGIMVGETMTLESLLYAAMLSSANEACNIIAEYIGGSISNFVSMMNQRAAELGCTGTNFTNTHGLPNDDHYSTARDFTKIGLEASRHELLMQLCSTPSYVMPGTNLSGERTLNSSNALISNSGIYGPNYVYEYANGMKTGHTSAAGYCLVSTAEKDGIQLLAAVFSGTQTWNNSTAEYSNFQDSINMYEWVFNNFSYREVLRSADSLTTVPVEMGSNSDSVSVRPESSITVLLPNDSDFSEFRLELKFDHEEKGESLSAPITAGQVLGTVTLKKDNVTYGTVNLVAASGIDLSKTDFIKAEIGDAVSGSVFKIIVIVLFVILAAYIAIVVIYRVRRMRHKRALRQAKLERLRAQRAQEQAGVSYDPSPVDAPSFTERPSNVTGASSPKDSNTPDQNDIDYFEEFFKGK